MTVSAIDSVLCSGCRQKPNAVATRRARLLLSALIRNIGRAPMDEQLSFEMEKSIWSQEVDECRLQCDEEYW